MLGCGFLLVSCMQRGIKVVHGGEEVQQHMQVEGCTSASTKAGTKPPLPAPIGLRPPAFPGYFEPVFKAF